MRIEDIMTKRVRTVSPQLDALAAWQEMRAARIHHLIVLDEGRVVGIVSERDLGGERGGAPRSETTVAELMTPNVAIAAPETTLRKAANLMRGRVIGCLPVVDGKRLVGIVTTTDLLDLIGRGAERPTADSTRWTLRRRAPRRGAPQRAKPANGATRA